jgi:hypothetical protein
VHEGQYRRRAARCPPLGAIRRGLVRGRRGRLGLTLLFEPRLCDRQEESALDAVLLAVRADRLRIVVRREDVATDLLGTLGLATPAGEGVTYTCVARAPSLGGLLRFFFLLWPASGVPIPPMPKSKDDRCTSCMDILSGVLWGGGKCVLSEGCPAARKGLNCIKSRSLAAMDRASGGRLPLRLTPESGDPEYTFGGGRYIGCCCCLSWDGLVDLENSCPSPHRGNIAEGGTLPPSGWRLSAPRRRGLRPRQE